ncbi:MAG TPA: hypothetical protein DC047_16135 [Blastocatellia bacterium]|nr:hypothetical protein [Blastocatellia bacterium]
MSASITVSDGKKEACKTYLEQTKLLVTLASAFLFAPAGLVAILKDRVSANISHAGITWFIIIEALFIGSVLMGYIVLGSLAGSQDTGEFDVFRPATRVISLFQFGFYLAGIIMFVVLTLRLVT